MTLFPTNLVVFIFSVIKSVAEGKSDWIPVHVENLGYVSK